MAISALVIAAIVVCALSIVASPSQPSASGWTTVSVGAHQTLWELASSHPVEGLGTAATVELIREQNRLESSVLFVGQTVRVPAEPASLAAVAMR